VNDRIRAHEIAERLGVARPQVVHTWRRRYPDFPQPVGRLRQALVWAWPDVERWARKTGRLDTSTTQPGATHEGARGQAGRDH
jgi:predicted DNA-binding transcriptional regulator AlpA